MTVERYRVYQVEQGSDAKGRHGKLRSVLTAGLIRVSRLRLCVYRASVGKDRRLSPDARIAHCEMDDAAGDDMTMG